VEISNVIIFQSYPKDMQEGCQAPWARVKQSSKLHKITVTKPSNAQHNPNLGSNLIPNNMTIISHYANDLIEISTHAL
jgi:hypothetical protein